MPKLKHYFPIILSLFLPLWFISCSQAAQQDQKRASVLVTLAPYKFFVERIAGDTVDVKLIVPKGASPHSYEPNARQILDTSHADVWFLIGETFEERALQALSGYRTSIVAVDMRNGIPLISEHDHHDHGHCSHHACADPHIWMSPLLVKKQAEAIARTLIHVYPEHAPIYKKNLMEFQRELDSLDREIRHILKNMKNRTILVSHPSYAYFCQDYGLTQVSIEFEGKDPSPRQLTRLLELAKKSRSPIVYIQVQYPSKGARLIADQIGAIVVELDPYAEDYMPNMLRIAEAFSEQ